MPPEVWGLGGVLPRDSGGCEAVIIIQAVVYFISGAVVLVLSILRRLHSYPVAKTVTQNLICLIGTLLGLVKLYLN